MSLGSAAPACSGARIEIAHPGVLEWFGEHGPGVEQGWTVPEAPQRGDAREFAGAEALWIGLGFEGLDVQITEDGLAAKLVDERSQERLRYSALAAFDADGKALPAQLRVVRGEIGICVDDREARYPVSIDPLLGPPVFVWESNQPNAKLDRCMAAGDVNGDGYGDFLAAAERYNTGSANAGIVWVFHGAPNGLSPVPNWTSSGPNQTNAFFGGYTTALGDINGDGYDDVAIGADQYSNGQAREGAVFVYLGSPLGLQNSPVWTLEGNTTDLELTQVRYGGDFNGDNLDDLVVSSHALPGAAGVVRVYFGSTSPITPVAPNWTLTAADVAAFGVQSADFQDQSPRAAGAGDIDGDGYDDLLVGAYTNSSTVGHALLYLGGPTGLANPSSPAWHVSTGGVGGRFGYVRPAGDLNGDGFPDVTVAAPMYTGTAQNSGAVFVYLNNAGVLPATETLRIDGPAQAGANFGEGFVGTGTSGDVDGDGFADLVFGAYGVNSLAGIAFVYRGSASGVSALATQTLNPPGGGCSAGCWFGSSSGTAGDVDGDGRNEVFVCGFGHSNPELEEGGVWLYYGQLSDATFVTPSAPGHPSSVGVSAGSLGSSVSSSGDVNGDGISDVLLGAPLYDIPAGSADAGRVELHLGSPNGTTAGAAWSFDGGGPNWQLGASVAFAGDVDNDGFGDVLVGEPRHSSALTNQGRVYLFRGNANGSLGATPAFSFSPGEVGALAGSWVAGAGDLNGDGRADVLIGAPGTHLGQFDRGAVYVYYGKATAPYLVAGPVLDAGQAGIRYGACVAGAGDVNGDGFCDVLVGAPKGGSAEEGLVQLFLGSINGLSPSVNWSWVPLSAGAHAGACVASAGDVDNDGLADLVVGAPDYQAATLGGAAFVFRGKNGAAPNVILPPQVLANVPASANASFGKAVGFAGDPNGDGFSDVAVGAPNFNPGLPNAGRLCVFHGSSSGVSLTPGWTRDGSANNAQLGAALSPAAGDQDGDAFSDLIAGGPGFGSGAGTAVLYEGSTAYATPSVCQQRKTNDVQVAQLLSLNDQSTANIRMQVSSRNYQNLPSTVAGRERIRLEYELRQLGLPLDGSVLQHGGWDDSGTNSTLNLLAGGLSPGYGYAWRARVQQKNPLFPHTRWFQIPGNARREKKFGLGSDCNVNNVPDDTDIANLTSADCDPVGPLGPDGIPDECELAGNNLNGNLIPDTCEAQIAFCTPNVGGVIACPCNNNPTGADRGCDNSLGTGGAAISGTGTASLANDTLVISASGIAHAGTSCTGSVTSVTCILMQGPVLNAGGVAFGDGVRCFGGALKRLNTASSVAGVYTYGPGVALRSAQLGDPIAAFSVRHYLVYYRDSCSAFCPSSNFNSTNGWRVIWDS